MQLIILSCYFWSNTANPSVTCFSEFKLFVGNLNSEKDFDELKSAMAKFFSKAGLEILDVRLGGSRCVKWVADECMHVRVVVSTISQFLSV